MSDLAGRSVLVTGSDGFIGSHLVERLLDLGAEVRAFCLYNSNGHLGWLEDLDRERLEAVDVRLGDIRDPRFVLEAVDGTEVVFHLAALIAIPYSYQAPESFVDTNVRGTLNVLEAVRQTGTPLMINTSTSEVYGTPQTLPISEDHPLVGQSPYSATKIAADKLAESYVRAFDTPYGRAVTTICSLPPRFVSFCTAARMTMRPRPVVYASRMPSLPRMNAPVGKSGPGTWRINSSMLHSGFFNRCFNAAATSRRLCGGTFVAMPTAIPLVPFTSRFGNRAGSTFGSRSRSSKFAMKSTVSFSMSASRSIAIGASRASV